MPEPRLQGLVVAGGDSSRMGRDKPFLRLDGEPWWHRQSRLLLACGADGVWLARRPGQQVPAGALCIHDLVTDAGPLAGLHSGLLRSPAPLLAVLAVDMPLLGPEWFPALLAQCGCARGAAFSHGGFHEPLAAVYPRTALPLVLARLAAGRCGLQGLCTALEAAGRLRVLPLPERLRGQAPSLNTPASLALQSRRPA